MPYQPNSHESPLSNNQVSRLKDVIINKEKSDEFINAVKKAIHLVEWNRANNRALEPTKEQRTQCLDRITSTSEKLIGLLSVRDVAPPFEHDTFMQEVLNKHLTKEAPYMGEQLHIGMILSSLKSLNQACLETKDEWKTYRGAKSNDDQLKNNFDQIVIGAYYFCFEGLPKTTADGEFANILSILYESMPVRQGNIPKRIRDGLKQFKLNLSS